MAENIETPRIIGTCGHLLTEEWWDSSEGSIVIKAHDKTGARCVSYLVVCPKCKELYKSVILETVEDRKKWLGICNWPQDKPDSQASKGE